jgi:hypothetical protein
MSWIGLTALIVFIAAALIGAVIFARHRGRLGGGAALLLMLIILGGASVVLLYPSALTVQGGERPQH